jgi:hypothetical protein
MPPKFVHLCARLGIQGKLTLFIAGVLLVLAMPAAMHGRVAARLRSDGTFQRGTRMLVAASLPQGRVGVAYSGVVGVRGGTAPYAFTVAGSLPPGLALNSATGVISGVPQSSGLFNFLVNIADAQDNTSDRRLSISISAGSAVAVQLSPSSTTVASGATQQFFATVSGSSNAAVRWSTTAGSISSSGVLTAPTVSTSSFVTVTAASVVSPDSKAFATVAVKPPSSPSPSPSSISVSVNPLSAVLKAGSTQQFSASVSGTSNTSVIWSTTAGSISSNGVLTAPAVSATSYVTVTAKSAAMLDAKASATVTVSPQTTPTPVTVSVNPGSASVASGATQQFTAAVSGSSNTGVTWSATAGSITSSGLWTAPTVTASTAVRVTATSVASSTSAASASVTVNPSAVPVSVAVNITPGSALVASNGSVQFSATVTGSTNTAVTWKAGFGSISASGLYTAPASGTDTVIVTSQADPTKAASATVTVQSSSPQVGTGGGGGTTAGPGGNAYCTPSGTWSGASTDGPANLPTQCMYTPLSGTPSPGVVHGPDSTTAAVQSDINAAACGDTIIVAAGSTLSTLSLPAKKCDNAHWITIKSSGASSASFPAEGKRMTPCWSGIASMPNRPAYSCPSPQVLTFKIVTPASSNGIVAPGGDHYRIIGAEITRITTGGVPVYNLVDLSSTSTQTNNIIFDRVWFHGINQDGHFPMASQSVDTSTTRAIYLGQSNHIAVIDSYLSDFYDTGSMSANGNTDAQCIGGGFGTIVNSGWGVYKFVNNHCEASGEGILLGGSVGPKPTPAGCTIGVNCNLDVPTDIEVRENYFFKPLSWNGNTTVPVSYGWPVGKNGFEIKIGARALFEGNVIENVWYSAQVGYCWSTAPKNQSNGGSPSVATAPTALTHDFTYRYNYCYNAAYGIGLYQSMDAGCANCQAQGANRISIHDNVIGDFMNLGNLSSSSTGDGLELMTVPDSTGQNLNQMNNIKISHNTFVKAIRGLTSFGGGAGQMHNITMQDNIMHFGTYGFMDIGFGGGCDTPFGVGNFAYSILNACVSNWTVDHNAVFNWNGGALGANWPAGGTGSGNFFFNGNSGVGFINYGTGNSNFNPGNYSLTTSSPLHNAGSDGRDVGADITTLLTAISGVRQ